MTPPEGPRGRLRSNHACVNCRRKKTRCPGEKPACSCCVRLNQPCSYASVARASQGDHQSDDRLAYLEEKLDLILNGNIPIQATGQAQAREQIKARPETSRSTTACPAPTQLSYSTRHPFPLPLNFGDSSSRPPSLAISEGIELYFDYCHRQPIWCFDREEIGDQSLLPDEIVYSILALTSRFSREHNRWQHYSDNAKSVIMLRVANGTVELVTIESLCLLSYSYFIDGDVHLGRFHLGLAFQLCRSAMLDIESAYTADDPFTERKKRLFWSLQSLEQSYGRQSGLLSVSTEAWRPSYFPRGGDQGLPKDLVPKPPPLPTDNIGCSASTDTGIWSTATYFGWVWSRVRTYVSDCAGNRLKEPWRHDSMYSMVLSDLMEIENRTSLCHRYDSVKFYECNAEQLRINRAYWVPWLKLQFTYHASLTVLNHPFLYIMASKHNPNLAIPNSFWRRSSEIVLLHATWIVRIIDMVSEKQFRLTDPFFGHMAAIAATVHLYYCCAVDPRLKYKSSTDFAKCRRFLKRFASFSRACETLDQVLDKMTQIASGSESVDHENFVPSKVNLSIPLMWDVLQFSCIPESQEMSVDSVLHPSLCPTTVREDMESSTLEITVTTSPEITVNTADGGQGLPMPSYLTSTSSEPATPGNFARRDKLVAPTDSLMLNTPWLWADPTQLVDMDDMGYQDWEPAIGDIEGSTWWDLGNL